MLEDLFMNPYAHFHVKELYVNTDEMSSTGILNEVHAKFKDKVILGSYPDFYNSYHKVKLTLESQDATSLQEAVSCLREIACQLDSTV